MTSLPRLLGITGLVALLSFARAGEPGVTDTPVTKKTATETIPTSAPPADPVMAKLHQRAEAGDATAQFVSGRHYATGDKVKKDDKAAFAWFFKSAMQGNPAAQAALAESYRNGVGVTRDMGEAVRWYRFAAEAGVAEARLALGEMYEAGAGVKKDFAEAARLYRAASTQNVALAQYRLATLIGNRAVEPAYQNEAASLLRAAAAQGHAPSQYAYGALLLGVRGKTRNAVEGARQVGASAAQGWRAAQYHYGLLYLAGDGVPKDPSQAEHWLGLAAKAGEKQAQLELGCLIVDLTPLPERDARAAALVRDPAMARDARALYALGVLSRSGRGMKKNIPGALACFQAAATAGDPRASYTLACWYENGGDGVSANRTFFETWLERAQNQGYAPAQNHRAATALVALQQAAARGEVGAQYALALRYDKGDELIAANPEEAFRWFEAAAEQGHRQSQYETAKRCATGAGTTKNIAKAMRLYRLAGQQGDTESWVALARLYTEEKEIPKDVNEASYCIRAAAELNDPYAQSWYGVRCWNGDGVLSDQVTGYAWVLLSVEQGLSPDEKPASQMRDMLDDYGRRRAAERAAELKRGIKERMQKR